MEEANTALDAGRLAGVSAAAALGFDKEAADRAKAIRESLDALRQGPHGERRRSCKERIIRKGESENA